MTHIDPDLARPETRLHELIWATDCRWSRSMRVAWIGNRQRSHPNSMAISLHVPASSVDAARSRATPASCRGLPRVGLLNVHLQARFHRSAISDWSSVTCHLQANRRSIIESGVPFVRGSYRTLERLTRSSYSTATSGRAMNALT